MNRRDTKVPWTAEEDALLDRMWNRHTPVVAIAERLNRTQTAIANRIRVRREGGDKTLFARQSGGVQKIYHQITCVRLAKSGCLTVTVEGDADVVASQVAAWETLGYERLQGVVAA